MFGDPRACREHARRCSELAVLAATPEERQHLLSLESVWIRRAVELEGAEAFLKTMDEIDFKPPTAVGVESPYSVKGGSVTGYALGRGRNHQPPSRSPDPNPRRHPQLRRWLTGGVKNAPAH